MIIYVGLGNPGKELDRTRHNVGYRVVENLCRQLSLPEVPKVFVERKKFLSQIADLANVAGTKHDAMCVKPVTFMNESGQAVEMVLKYHHLDGFDQFYVCHDDLDLPLGSYKIHWNKGPKVHNGLSSIYDHLGTKEFWHVRIGVDGREGDRTLSGRDYVLQTFSADEEVVIKGVIESVVKELMGKIK